MVCQYDGDIGKRDTNGRNNAIGRVISGIKNVDCHEDRIKISDISIHRSFIRQCLSFRYPRNLRETGKRAVPKEFPRSGLPLMESRGDIIYFILETPLLRRSAPNAADVDPPSRRFRMHFSRCAAGGGVKSISRSRLDKKHICMPTICNPPAGCRKIDGADSYLPLNNTVGESA